MRRATAPEIQLGMCVTSVYEGGFVGIQVDAFGEHESGVQPMEALHPYGFEGRPVDRDDSKAGCSAMYWWDGDDGHVIALGSSTHPDVFSELQKGSSRQYAAWGAYFHLDHANRRAHLYVPYDGGTKAHEVLVDTVANTISVSHGDGITSVVITDDRVTLRATRVDVEADDVRLAGGSKQVACVGDLVAVVIPALATAAGPVAAVNPLAVTSTGGTSAVGQIISGRSNVKAG